MPAIEEAMAALWSGFFAFIWNRAGNGLPARNLIVSDENCC
jgi:hypothetical protein